MTFTAGFLLLLWVVASILVNGITLLHFSTKLRGLELFGYGAAAGVLLHGLLGWGIAALPLARLIFVATLIVLAMVSAVYVVALRVALEFWPALSKGQKICLG